MLPKHALALIHAAFATLSAAMPRRDFAVSRAQVAHKEDIDSMHRSIPARLCTTPTRAGNADDAPRHGCPKCQR